MNIKAIQTKYKGYNFRSRLEARWAVFFDALGIEWDYEPEGFERIPFCGGEPIRYLPDFYLKKSATWVEVKGNMTPDDACRMAHIMDWGSPLPFVDDSLLQDKYDHNQWKSLRENGADTSIAVRGILLLGEIPEPIHGICVHPLITQHKGLHRQWSMFVHDHIVRLNDGQLHMLKMFSGDLFNEYEEVLDSMSASKDDLLSMFSTSSHSVSSYRAYPQVKNAYAAARSARFEFGQSGATA